MSPQGLNPQSRGKVSTILGSTHPTTKPAHVLGIRVLNLKAVWCVITVKKSVLFDGDLKFIFVVWKKSFGAEHNCSLCHRSNDILQINVCFSQHKCLTNYANKCIRFVTISHSYWHFIVFHFILGFFLMQFLPILVLSIHFVILIIHCLIIIFVTLPIYRRAFQNFAPLMNWQLKYLLEFTVSLL